MFCLRPSSFLACLLIIVFPLSSAAQARTDPWLEELLRYHGSDLLRNILSEPDTFRYQLIFTRIDRDSANQPHFTNYYLHVDPDLYFNPASMVKLPVACMALEKLEELKKYGIGRETTMITDSAFDKQTRMDKDTSAASGFPSVGQYVRRIFLISDNKAYNRLYEFVGQQRLNEELWKMGYTGARITRRFVTMTEEQNRHTNPIRFMQGNKILYTQPPAYNPDSFDFSKIVRIGRAHYDRQDNFIPSPMDFTTHNKIPLEDLQRILQSVLFPQSVLPNQRFRISPENYRFLYQYMSEYPSESRHPAYDTSEYFNSYTKFFMFRAGRGSIPPYIRVFNKTGWSYGFLTDAAYIVDFRNKVEFMLTGNIYTNSDGVLNDDHYDYETIGYPFFKEVGQILYQYELKRNRTFPPDLSRFRLEYR